MQRKEIAPYVAREKFAWPGGYEMFAVTDDGGILCYKCCETESEIIATAYPNDGWYVSAYDATCNYDSDEPMHCDHCQKTIVEGV